MPENIINKDLDFQEILNKAKAFANEIITQEELSVWGNNILVKSSLPLMDKLTILMNLTTEYEYSDANSMEVIVCELYRNIFFHLYLEGYLGVPNISPSDITYENYDLLEPLFGPWIEAYAARDIQMFKEMLRDSLNFNNVKATTQAIQSVDTEHLKDATESTKEFVDLLNRNKQLIGDLKDLSVMNDPMTAKVVDAIKAQTLENN